MDMETALRAPNIQMQAGPCAAGVVNGGSALGRSVGGRQSVCTLSTSSREPVKMPWRLLGVVMFLVGLCRAVLAVTLAPPDAVGCQDPAGIKRVKGYTDPSRAELRIHAVDMGGEIHARWR